MKRTSFSITFYIPNTAKKCHVAILKFLFAFLGFLIKQLTTLNHKTEQNEVVAVIAVAVAAVFCKPLSSIPGENLVLEKGSVNIV